MRNGWAIGCGWLLAVGTVLAEDHWPQFRGPSGNGQASSSLPTEWDADKNLAWKVAIPGFGWSAPIVWQDQVYLTTAVAEQQPRPKNMDAGARDMGSMPLFGKPKPPTVSYRWQLLCLDRATGKTLWTSTAAERPPLLPIHPSNTYATETPATDGERIYVHFGPIGLVVAFQRDGQIAWKKDIGAYPIGNGFGTGSSPALADGRLFIQCDNEEKSFLLALDAKTGGQLWKADRAKGSSWATPFLWRNRLRTELVTAGAGKVVSYDPATGQELWLCGGFPGGFSSSPAADAERIYVGTSPPMSQAPLFAIQAGANGDITPARNETTTPGIAWTRTRAAPGLSSPVVAGGYVYIAGSGTLACYDAQSGEPKFKQRLPGGGKMVAASLWTSGELLFVLDEAGTTSIFAVGPEFKLVRQCKLDETFWSTPASAGGDLFLRGTDHLYCIRQAAPVR